MYSNLYPLMVSYIPRAGQGRYPWGIAYGGWHDPGRVQSD